MVSANLITFSTIIDDREVQASMSRLTALLEDFAPEMKEIGGIVAARIRRNFIYSKSLFAALAPRTIKARQGRIKRGEKLVSGLETPLRAFTGRLFAAATDTGGGAEASAYTDGKLSVTVGVDPDRLIYARTVLLGREIPGGTIPARPAVDINDGQVHQACAVLRGGIHERIASTQRSL